MGHTHKFSIDLFQGLDTSRPKSDTAIGVILFVLAFVGCTVNLPCFLSLQTESYFHRIVWRYLVLGLLITPRFLYDVSANVAFVWDLLLASIFPVFFLALLNTCYIYLVCLAVHKTFVVHTLFLSSFGGVLNVVWKIVRGGGYTAVEYIGIALSVFGAYLFCCEDASLGSKVLRELVGKEILVGNLIALSAGVLNAIYSTYASAVTISQECPFSVFLILLSTFVVVISLFLAYLIGDHIEIFSTDSSYGILAFISDWHSFLYGFLGLGVMAGFAYHYFSLMAQSYIGSTLISVSYTLVPAAAQVTAYLFGAQSVLPGSFTAIGSISLFFGCSLVALNYSDHKQFSRLPLVMKSLFSGNRASFNEYQSLYLH